MSFSDAHVEVVFTGYTSDSVQCDQEEPGNITVELEFT